ncbi:proteoglycan 4 [Drosophila tropicalis]|uniref:proteoglycan 4 n=1 Tax=Drosophila tropicalis TaxID=46794 RepID=UPI0035ABF595
MQPQVEFKPIALLLLLLQANRCMSSMMRTDKDWNYFNDQHYEHSHLMDNPGGINNFEYVDYQARCEQGGEPVCATNGTQEFYFENECKLESHNMKSLFQHGTVLERTDLERCSPNCETIKCPTVYQPVCAAPSEAADAVYATTNGVTFGNLCEVRKHECVSQRAMRIVNQGVCRELKLKRRNRKNRNKNRKPKRVQPNIKSEQNSSSNVHFLITTRADRMKAAMSSSTTSASTTRSSPTRTTSSSIDQNPTKSPMRFREFQYSAAPHVSVSQAENPYNIYNIPDVGKDYENIMDNELSVYVPEVGYVTDLPPSTTTVATTSTTTTTTTTPKPTTTTTTMKPITSTTTTAKPKMITTTPKPLITTYIMTISPSTKRLISSTTSKASTTTTTTAPSWSSTTTTTSQPLQVTTSTTARTSSVTTTNAPLKTTESTISTKHLEVTTPRVEIATTKPPATAITSSTSAMTTPPTTTSSTTPQQPAAPAPPTVPPPAPLRWQQKLKCHEF